MVQKNDIIEINIDGIGYNGEGIAHLGGYTIFIKYALPQEKVRAVIILAKPTFAVGKLLQVISSSPYRVEPFCPVYYKCGGCGLQHIAYEKQLEFKTEAVKEAFKKAAKISVQPASCIPSPEIKNYRNKMSLPVRGDKIGFFAENSHRVIDIDECPIQFENNSVLITAFKKYLAENGLSGYNETDNSGAVRHLAARRVGGITTVTAVVNGGGYVNKLKPFGEVLKSIYGDKFNYYININTAHNNIILGKTTEFVCGNGDLTEVDGLQTAVHPQSFFQVNDGVRKLIYDKAAECVSGEIVYDCYSGAGILSAMLARRAKHVTAIEIEPKATENAMQLIKANGIRNVTPVCGDCAEEIPKILDQTPDAKQCTVVLDPPRAGCDERVINAINGSNVPKVVYISCNPATLARDCMRLSHYRIAELTPFDMFPQTSNVETVAVLKRESN